MVELVLMKMIIFCCIVRMINGNDDVKFDFKMSSVVLIIDYLMF